MKKPLRVLFVSVEVAPFAKVGGLADVAGSLPAALRDLGQDVRTLMPAYGMVLKSKKWKPKKACKDFKVSLREGHESAASLHEFEHNGTPIWLLGGEGYFDAVSESCEVYTPGRDAYLFFAAAALEACREMDWIPDVVHCNDWHTGFISVLMREKAAELWDSVGAVYSIHNLAYQGEFGEDTLEAVGLPPSLFNPNQLETYGSVNFLKSGCVFSDEVNTVSPTYAKEIQTPEFGCRLEGLMKYLAGLGRLRGILNGIDTAVFDPAHDGAIAKPFSADDPSGKKACRESLLQELDLPTLTDGPVVGMVTRLSSQKGFDLVLEAAPTMLADGATLIVQGLGDPWAAAGLRELEAASPKQVRFVEKFDAELAQRVYAGTDIFLMPSAFEPCGLGQMIAMRYGSIPLVRKTGGLADTVFEGVNGFVFEPMEVNSLLAAFHRASELFADPKAWGDLVGRAMNADHSWTQSAHHYVELYRDAIQSRSAGNLAAAG